MDPNDELVLQFGAHMHTVWFCYNANPLTLSVGRMIKDIIPWRASEAAVRLGPKRSGFLDIQHVGPGNP